MDLCCDAKRRLELARDALRQTGWMAARDIDEDVAPRIVEMASALRAQSLDLIREYAGEAKDLRAHRTWLLERADPNTRANFIDWAIGEWREPKAGA